MTTAANSVDCEPLAALLGRHGADDAALIAPEDKRVLTYGQVAARVETLAGRLATVGVRRGDRVALALPNGPEFIELVLAITALGAAAAPLNPAYTESEFTYYLSDINPRLVLLGLNQPTAERAAQNIGTVIVTVTTEGDGSPALIVEGTGVREEAPFEPGGQDDVAIVLHTSGTTSRPKQVPLLQRNLMASARADRDALPAR